MSQVGGIHYKYVAYSSGFDLPHRLFNLDADPDEEHDLLVEPSEEFSQIAEELDEQLNNIIASSSSDTYYRTYRDVSTDIEAYNKQSFSLWRANQTKNEYAEQVRT